MKIHTLKRTQILPVSIDEAWAYFSSPENLSEITPDYLNFKILSDLPDRMYEGMIIQYKVHPFFGIPVHWVTEITHEREPYYFVDEQRFGPYTLWHHQHHFKQVKGGVEMIDEVTYKMPFGILGEIVHTLIVKKQLEDIFDYRYQVLERKFGSKS